MSDLVRAKAGDAIAKKARVAFLKALRFHPVEHLHLAPEKVGPKAEGKNGQWFCCTCGHFAQNNMGAWSHQESNPRHKFAWRNFETGKIEEP